MLFQDLRISQPKVELYLTFFTGFCETCWGLNIKWDDKDDLFKRTWGGRK